MSSQPGSCAQQPRLENEDWDFCRFGRSSWTCFCSRAPAHRTAVVRSDETKNYEGSPSAWTLPLQKSPAQPALTSRCHSPPSTRAQFAHTRPRSLACRRAPAPTPTHHAPVRARRPRPHKSPTGRRCCDSPSARHSTRHVTDRPANTITTQPASRI